MYMAVRISFLFRVLVWIPSTIPYSYDVVPFPVGFLAHGWGLISTSLSGIVAMSVRGLLEISARVLGSSRKTPIVFWTVPVSLCIPAALMAAICLFQGGV